MSSLEDYLIDWLNDELEEVDGHDAVMGELDGKEKAIDYKDRHFSDLGSEELKELEDHLFEAYQQQVMPWDVTKAPTMWEGDDEVPEFVDRWVDDVIDMLDPMWDQGFDDIPHSAALKVHEEIGEALTQPQGWSVDSIAQDLTEEFEQIDRKHAEIIARQEVASILNKARVVAFKARGDFDSLVFDWVGPDDVHTTKICTEVKEEIEDRGGAVTLDQLEDILRDKAEKYQDKGGTPGRVEEYVPHFQCRHTIVERELEDLKSVGVEKDRVYVDDPSEAPEDVEVEEGEQGGLYYETDASEDNGGGGRDPLDEAKEIVVDDFTEAVNRLINSDISAQRVAEFARENSFFDDDGMITKDYYEGIVENESVEVERYGAEYSPSMYQNEIQDPSWDEFADGFSGDIEKVQKPYEVWAGYDRQVPEDHPRDVEEVREWGPKHEKAAAIWTLASEMSGNSNLPREELGDADEETVEALREFSEHTTEVLREIHGDSVTVYRGLRSQLADEIRDANKEGDSVTVEHRPAESWTPNPKYAADAASWEREEGMMIKQEVPVEDIIAASHTGETLFDFDHEYIVAGEEETYGPEDLIDPMDLEQFVVDAREATKMDKSSLRLSAEEGGFEWLQAPLEYKLDGDSSEEKSMRIIELSKARVYVDDPSEAPDWADVQEGQQGGYYYETDDSPGSSGDGAEPAEEASAVSVQNWPEEHTLLTAEQVQQKTSLNVDRYDEEIADDFVEHFEGYENESVVSAWRFNEDNIIMRADADEDTITHEMGHGVLGVYGVSVNDKANLFAHFFQGDVPAPEFGEPVPEIAEDMAQSYLDNPNVPDQRRQEARENLEEVKERYEGEKLDREDMYLFVDPEQMDEEPPDKVIGLAEELNRAWDRQVTAANSPDEDADDYVIGNPYSATNPHETMSMTHETLMGDTADPHALENLYRRQPELLDAWTDLFEPRDIQADILNQLYKEFGGNEAFDELPYPEHEGVLEE